MTGAEKEVERVSGLDTVYIDTIYILYIIYIHAILALTLVNLDYVLVYLTSLVNR